MSLGHKYVQINAQKRILRVNQYMGACNLNLRVCYVDHKFHCAGAIYAHLHGDRMLMVDLLSTTMKKF